MVVVFYKRDDWWIGSIETQHYSGCLILRYDCQNMKYGTNNLQLENTGLAMIKIMRSVKEDLCCTLYVLENSCKNPPLERTLMSKDLFKKTCLVVHSRV
jgi:hypothetical protein